MEYIDVTLRDGGHQVGFNWPHEFVNDHINILSSFPEIKYIELGYWKQSGKYKGDFYSLNEKLLEKICLDKLDNQFTFMIDYHYCSHNLIDYPKKESFPQIDMIRMTSRSSDLKESLSFLNRLKQYTNFKVSLNIFNVTNYKFHELLEACRLCKSTQLDYIYFADTHGNLDLGKTKNDFKKLSDEIKQLGMRAGFHLHDHTGKAYYNFRLLKELGYSHTDVSLNGLGKGMGNLKLENCIDISSNPKILDFITQNYQLLKMVNTPYGLISGLFSITDHYAIQAHKNNISPSKFYIYAKNVLGDDKDVFNSNLIKN